MIVVSDTSPINYLVLIGCQDLLPTPPDWIEVRSAPEIPTTLAHLDSGEREALALALAVGANFVLVDERKGRQAAEDHGLEDQLPRVAAAAQERA